MTARRRMELLYASSAPLNCFRHGDSPRFNKILSQQRIFDDYGETHCNFGFLVQVIKITPGVLRHFGSLLLL